MAFARGGVFRGGDGVGECFEFAILRGFGSK